MPSIDVLLPCLDEVRGLAWVLDRMPAGLTPLVVDNGSTDGSAELALRRGARVVRATQRGYGAACHAGLVAASSDVVVVMDADASLDPAELPGVLAPVLEGAVDLVVGARRPEPGAWPWHLRFANAEVARRVRVRTGVRLRDIGPVRVARRTALLDLDLQDRRSGYPVETVLAAARAGWRITGVDVTYRRRAGRSKVTGTPLGVWQAVRDMSAVLDAR